MIVGRLRWKEFYISNKMTPTMMRVQKIREKGEGEWATMEERERDGYFGDGSKICIKKII